MTTNIRQRFDRRLVALVAVLAIGVSGLASMAALTATLTVSSSFDKAVAELSGNGIATAVTLFDGEVLSPNGALPGTAKYQGLDVLNSGNVALTVTGGGATPGGTLAADMEVTVAVAPAKDTALTCDATSFTAGGAGTGGWNSLSGGWSGPGQPWSPISPISLNESELQQYCYAVRLVANSTASGSATVTQTFTGNE